MNILFDQGVPVPLRRQLVGHSITTAYERGWNTLANGMLLSTAETAGFDLLVTTDQNLRYQQNLNERRIAILVLRSTSWPRIRASTAAIQSTIDAMAIDHIESFLSPHSDKLPYKLQKCIYVSASVQAGNTCAQGGRPS